VLMPARRTERLAGDARPIDGDVMRGTYGRV
jgi:hypothetical protein